MDTDIRLEGFFYKLRSGDIFYAKGVSHPPNAVVAYPKYVVDSNGDRVDRLTGTRYRRVASVAEEYSYTISRYRAYVRFDKFYGREVVVVPLTDVEVVYNPLEKAKELLYSGTTQRDAVLGDAREMLLDLINGSGVREVGISGSILVNLYTEDSDIDIVVYGRENGLKVYRYLLEVVDKDQRYRRYTKDDAHKLFSRRASETPLTFEQVVMQESRKVLEGFFKNREYFSRLVKYSWEEPPYDSYRCVKVGKALMKLRVIDDRESIFTPCRYRVEVVEHIKGPRVDVVEVYSLRGRFTEIAKQDDIIVVHGTVELIEPKSGKSFYRLYLGDEGDYIALVKD